MENNTINYKSPNPLWFVIRIFILGILLLVLLFAITDMGKRSSIIKKISDLAEDKTFYDTYYYEGNYGALRDMMYMYDHPEDEYYGKYWEIVTANEHLQAYNDYKAGADAGVDNAHAFAEEEKKELEQMLANVKFPDNKERIRALLDSIE